MKTGLLAVLYAVVSSLVVKVAFAVVEAAVAMDELAEMAEMAKLAPTEVTPLNACMIVQIVVVAAVLRNRARQQGRHTTGQ